MSVMWLNIPAFADDHDLVFTGDSQPVVIRLQTFIDGQPLVQCYEVAAEHSLKQLFRWLDRNGDGFLDPQEARNVPPPKLRINKGSYPVNVAFNFAAFDTDGDGKLSLAEFLAYYRTFEGGPWQQRFHGSQPPGVGNAVSAMLFRRADRNNDGKLDSSELAALSKLLDEMDQNQDEMLDLDEVRGRRETAQPFTYPRTLWQLCTRKETVKLLKQYSQPPLQFVLTIRLGKRKLGETPLELVLAEGKIADTKIVAANEEEVILTFNNVRLSLRMAPESLAILTESARQDWVRRFEELDSGGKGTLSSSQAQADREFGQLFGLMDRNGDGQVQRQELLDWFREVQEPQLTQQFLRTMLHCTGEGHGLFDLLDTDRDGRLSRHELHCAPAILAGCDRNGDGAIEPNEIPRSFTVVLGPGQSDSPRTPDTYTGLPLAQQFGAPLWFRRMDRNRDGFLSPREFLGTADQFRQLDTDGDGLISRDEALQAARRK